MSPGQLAAFLTKELIHEEKKDDKAGLWKGIKSFFQANDDDSEDQHETKSE